MYKIFKREKKNQNGTKHYTYCLGEKGINTLIEGSDSRFLGVLCKKEKSITKDQIKPLTKIRYLTPEITDYPLNKDCLNSFLIGYN
jgi:hypothetical protein